MPGEACVSLIPEISTRASSLVVVFPTLPVTAIEGFKDTQISPTEVTRDLQENLLNCDAVLLVHEKAPAIQIRQFVTEYEKTKARRARPATQ